VTVLPDTDVAAVGRRVPTPPVSAGHDGVVAPKTLTRTEMTDLTKSLQALLDAIERDEMAASTATTYRVEGAVTALKSLLSAPSAEP
jgi:hypothetical protein